MEGIYEFIFRRQRILVVIFGTCSHMGEKSEYGSEKARAAYVREPCKLRKQK
jgi:hypothetical protein